jgi:hypothetical protein
MEVLWEIFPEHFISRRCEFPRPPCSPLIVSFGGTSKGKCTPLDYGLSITSRSQFGSKFHRFQKTWRGNQQETCDLVLKSVYTVMGNMLVICCTKRNKQIRMRNKIAFNVHLICNNILRIKIGRAIAQAVSRRLPTAAARVQNRVWSCGIL